MARYAVVFLLLAAGIICSTALNPNEATPCPYSPCSRPIPTKVCSGGAYDLWTILGYKLVRQDRKAVLNSLVAQVTKKIEGSRGETFKMSELQPFGKMCYTSGSYCTKVIEGCSKVQAGGATDYKFSTMLEYVLESEDYNDAYYYFRVNMEGRQSSKGGKAVLGKWTYQDVTNYD